MISICEVLDKMEVKEKNKNINEAEKIIYRGEDTNVMLKKY